jgi:hypothetical protein
VAGSASDPVAPRAAEAKAFFKKARLDLELWSVFMIGFFNGITNRKTAFICQVP